MYRARRIAAIVLARSGSSRLPGKMQLPFGSNATDGIRTAKRSTVLGTVMTRLLASSMIDDVVLATTTASVDDALAAAAEELGLRCIRGSEDDVVARMQQAVAELEQAGHAPDVLVRACADNPLVMPTVVEAGLAELVESGADLITPFEHATLPFGYGLVAMTRECLQRIDDEACEPAYREHVENYCFERPERFAVRYQTAAAGLAEPELCLTLDYAEDYERLLQCERLLRGVALEDQPQALIQAIQHRSVWVEGVSAGSPEGHDLILATRAPQSCGDPVAGLVVVDTQTWDGTPRFVLRYAGEREPLFVDRRALRVGDTPHAFLGYVAPLAIPRLRGGHARPVLGPPVLGRAGAGSEKQVIRGARRGFRASDDAQFPPQVALASGVAIELGLERVARELERYPDARLLVEPGAKSHAALRSVFGTERVQACATWATDPFDLVEVLPDGRLRSGSVEADGSSTIEAFWRSPEMQLARAELLNGAAA